MMVAVLAVCALVLGVCVDSGLWDHRLTCLSPASLLKAPTSPARIRAYALQQASEANSIAILRRLVVVGSLVSL
jgi:hypothetical protein